MSETEAGGRVASGPTPGLPLLPESEGPAVVDLQQRLAALGYATTDEAGTYGPGTEAAVTAFQTDRRLRRDGICGEQTWAALVEAGWCLGDRWLYLTEPKLRGDDVARLQRRLSALGFLGDRVDGIFGVRTGAATEEFQRNAGLTVDGIVGPATVQALARLGGRDDAQPLAQVVERETLRRGPHSLAGRTLVVAEAGGVGAPVDLVARTLTRSGALTVSVSHPDPSERALQANAAEAEAYLELGVAPAAGVHTVYYAGFSYESPAGRALAGLLHDQLVAVLGVPAGEVSGLALPVLRETRMPSVLVEVGPASVVVQHADRLATAVVQAVAAWVRDACA